jgi:hypothetical protein
LRKRSHRFSPDSVAFLAAVHLQLACVVDDRLDAHALGALFEVGRHLACEVAVDAALPGAAFQDEAFALAVGVYPEGEAGLHGAEETDQARADAVAGGGLQGQVSLAFLVVEEEQDSGGVGGGVLDGATQGVGDGAGVGLEVLQKDLLVSLIIRSA